MEALRAADRNGCTDSEQISVSRLKPLRGAEGGLDTLIGSEKPWPLRPTAHSDHV
jgi:hypothetical protein